MDWDGGSGGARACTYVRAIYFVGRSGRAGGRGSCGCARISLINRLPLSVRWEEKCALGREMCVGKRNVR